MATGRDAEAIARASDYEKHGTTFLGGSVVSCLCPKKECGGVASAEERDDCPYHRKVPAQLWHWAAECLGTPGA
jgi:hypothetical protein